MRLTEGMTAPQCTFPSPTHPTGALAIEGTVIVRYDVSETGAVSNARAIKGPSELRLAAEAASKGIRCTAPAKDRDGKPVAVVRVRAYRFVVKTR